MPLLAGEPTTPTQSWPRYRDGPERWAWARGKGSDGNGRGLLGAVLPWQEAGGGGWLRHPIASPPVLWKISVSLPEMKIQPWIPCTQTLDPTKMFITILSVLLYFIRNCNLCVYLFRTHRALPLVTPSCSFDIAWRNAISHMWWSYSCIVGRVCPSSQTVVIVTEWYSLLCQAGNLPSSEE